MLFHAVVTALALLNVAAASERRVLITIDPDLPQISVPWNESLATLGFAGTNDIPLNDPRMFKFATGLSPEQVHLSYWGIDRILVSWVTGDAQMGYKVKSPPNNLVPSLVWFGTAPGNYTSQVSGLARSYIQDYSGYNSSYNAVNYASGLIHHTLLTGLKPTTTYYYKVGFSSAWSKEYNFTTVATTLTPDRPLKITLCADLGQTYNTSAVVDHMANNATDVVFIIADYTYSDTYVSAGQPTISGAPNWVTYSGPAQTYQPRWDSFFRMVEPLVSHVPILGTNGNHEIEPQSTNTTHASYNHRLPIPPNTLHKGSLAAYVKAIGTPNRIDIPSQANNMFYSVDLPGAHAIFLTSYIPQDDFSPSSKQYKWLVSDLKKVNRTKTPWLLVSTHAPWYNSYNTHYKEAECFRQAYEPLLYSYGVDVMFFGHVHSYERTFPVYNNTRDTCGPVHVTIGDGGNQEKLYKDFMDTTNQSAIAFCSDPTSRKFPAYQPQRCFSYEPDGSYCYKSQPAWSAYREPSFGNGVLTIFNESTAQWDWHKNQEDARTMSDSIVLRRNYDCPNHFGPAK